MIGQTVTVTIDRPLGSFHPEHKDIYYPVNYGYVEGIIAPDGEEQDVYILGVDVPLKIFTGRIIAVIRRSDDIEEKWVAAPEGMTFTAEEIKEKVYFQEQYFESRVITSFIRQAVPEDAMRIAEIEVFNYRLNFYPIFNNDSYYFNELTVHNEAGRYSALTDNIHVYDDGAVKGFVLINGSEIVQLFVEPVLQGHSIGKKLLEFAVNKKKADHLYALEKNIRAISFYNRNGFILTDEKKYEEDTDELLVRLKFCKNTGQAEKNVL